MKMKINNLKFFVVFSLMLIVGCSLNKEDQKTEIRFVDLQGNARAIKTRIPEANAKIMSGQSSHNSEKNPSEIYNEKSLISGNLKEPKNNFTNKNTNPNTLKNNPSISLPENTAIESGNQELVENTPTVEYDFSKEDAEDINLKNKNIEIRAKIDSKNNGEYVQQNENELEPLSKNTKSINKKLNPRGSKIITYSNKKNPKNTKPKQYNNVNELNSQEGQEQASDEESSSEFEDAKAGNFYVQIGSFLNSKGAKERLNKTKEFGNGKVLIAYKNNKRIYRSVFGPFKSKKSALKLQSSLIESGNEAIIIKGK